MPLPTVSSIHSNPSVTDTPLPLPRKRILLKKALFLALEDTALNFNTQEKKMEKKKKNKPKKTHKKTKPNQKNQTNTLQPVKYCCSPLGGTNKGHVKLSLLF